MRKKILVYAIVGALCATGFARTSKDVAKEISTLNKQVESLKKEQTKLKKKPKVSYAKEQIRSGNVVKRMNTVEINRKFECAYHKGVFHDRRWTRGGGWRDEVCSKCSVKYYEWREYVNMLGDSQKATERIEEINEELDKLKDQLSELRQEKSELAREENEAKGGSTEKNIAKSSQSSAKTGGDDYMIVDLETGKVAYEAMRSQDESNERYQDNKYKTRYLVLRRIPAGKYWIGGPEDANTNIDLGKNSYHSVNVSKDYYFAIYELTVAQYDRIMGVTPQSNSIEPKGGLSYNLQRGGAYYTDVPASGPIAELNKNTGLTFDCPTTSMFEIANRAGCTTKWILGDTPDGLTEYAWLDGSNIPRPVGTKKPNNWGIYDTIGNQWEVGRDAWNSGDLARLQPDPLVAITASENESEAALMGNGVCEKHDGNTVRSRFSLRHHTFKTNTRVHMGCRLSIIDPKH